MKILFTKTVFCALLLCLCGCGSGNNASESKTITISGAFALYPLGVKWAEVYKETHPDVVIDISAGGAGKGMTDVLMDMTDIAMVSREVYPQEVEKGAVSFPVAKDAVVAIINAENPLLKQILQKGITDETARKIWIDGSIKSWGGYLGTSDKTALHAYTRSDACGAAETWASWFDKKQEDLGGVSVFGDPGIVAAVQNDKFAIGFANMAYAYDEETKLPAKNIVVLPIDIDGNGSVDANEDICKTKEQIAAAIESGVYPAPPSRELYLVTKGTPENQAVIDFIKYILSEGQNENAPAGYVRASAEGAKKGLEKLNVK